MEYLKYSRTFMRHLSDGDKDEGRYYYSQSPIPTTKGYADDDFNGGDIVYNNSIDKSQNHARRRDYVVSVGNMSDYSYSDDMSRSKVPNESQKHVQTTSEQKKDYAEHEELESPQLSPALASGKQKKAKAPTKRERWSNNQTAVCVKTWKFVHHELITGKRSEAWLNIKTAVDDVGSPKTLQQIKIKIKNLKSDYQAWRDSKRGTSNNLKHSKFYEDIDSVLGTRNVSHFAQVEEVRVINTRKEEIAGTENEVNMDEKIEKSKKEKETKMRMFSELIELQKENIKARREAEVRHENFIKDLLKGQQRLEREEREKDRDFFLNLAEILSKTN